MRPCAVHVQQALAAVPGVQDASVFYPEGQAIITVDSTSPPSTEGLAKAVEGVGYRVTSEAGHGQARR